MNEIISQQRLKLSKDAKQKLDAYVQVEREHTLLEGLMTWYSMAKVGEKRKYADQLVEHAQLLLDASKRLAELEKHE